MMGFPGGLGVKKLSVMQEAWVWSLAGKEPLEKEMATHPNILVSEFTWTEECARLQFMWLGKS